MKKQSITSSKYWEKKRKKMQEMPESEFVAYVRKALASHHRMFPHPDDRIPFGEFYNEIAYDYGRRKKD